METPNFQKTVKSKKPLKWFLIAAFIIGAILIIGLAERLWETNQDGHYQVKQAFYTGTMTVKGNSGTYGQWLGTIWTYKNVATIRFGEDEGEEASATLEAIPVIFSRGSEADISGLIRVKLPTSTEERLALKNEFAEGYGHFIESGVKPVINNSVKLAANMRTAQDAYTTLAQFQFAVSDQLQNGMYKTKSVIKYITRETGDVEEVRVTEILYDTSTGLPLREANRILELGVVVTECVIDVPVFDSLVKANISNQKSEAMKTELSKQEAIRAKQVAITAEQQGLALVAKAKYEREVEKVKEVTDASKRFEVAEFAAKEALEEAKKIKAQGDAKAFANRALVAAGLTPQQKMDMTIEIADKVSKNIANAPTPAIVIVGGEDAGTGADAALKVFGAERAIELVKKVQTTNFDPK